MLSNKIIISFAFLLTLSLTACVTGNDNNLVLQQHEEAIAKTPRVLELTVDGVAPSRDQQSHWLDFEVSAGQTIMLEGVYDPGNGASSADFDFTRSYHHTSYDADDAKAVEPNTERVQTIGSDVVAFSFAYTIPELDDEGEAFLPGDHINLTWWSSNDLGGQGFMDVNLIFK